jgi:hypothetical protein
MVACILLVLSAFSFVLAAPVPTQEVREACADAVEGDENMIILSGKRAPRGNPYEGEDSDLFSLDLSDTESPPQSPSAPNPASGSHPGVGTPSSPSGGSKSALLTAGGTEVPLDPKGAFKLGLPPPPGREGYLAKVAGQQSPFPEIEHAPPSGTTTGNQPTSPSGRKSISWDPTTKVHFYHDGPEELGLPPPPGREGYLAKVAKQQSLSPEIEHASPFSHFEPPPPPKPQSKGFVSNIKSKLGKLKFRPRFQRTVEAGA